MSKTIRIGTRDSELALYQANIVKSQLEFLGHKTELVPVKSTGDIVLNKPLYELGITVKLLEIRFSWDLSVCIHQIYRSGV